MESQLITLARMSAEKDADFQSAYLFLQWSRIEKSLSRVSVELCCGACGHVYCVHCGRVILCRKGPFVKLCDYYLRLGL